MIKIRNFPENVRITFPLTIFKYTKNSEFKWHSIELIASDLHAFQGKLNGKASLIRGVFIQAQGERREFS